MNIDLFNKIIKNMNDLNLNMESLIITQNNIEFSHFFTDEKATNIHSISKTITSVAFGIALSKGYFKDSIETFVMPYFNDITISNKDNIPYLKNMKIKHLLTLTAGYEAQILNENHLATLDNNINLIEFSLNYPIKHEPGSFFFYTNAPIYLLSTIIEKEVGMKLSEFVRKELIEKLDIKTFNWKECNLHHSMGCTGIEILPHDLHKIAKLFLNKGGYNNIQIIPKDWLTEMSTLKTLTPNNYDISRALPKYGYGYNLWICKNEIYYHDGSNGQYMIIAPEKNMVITTTAKENNMKPITKCMEELFY